MGKQRYRRKPHPCVLCEKYTYDWDHICRDCRQAWRKGARFQEAEDKMAALPEGMIEAVVARYWYTYHFAGTTGDKYHLAGILSESLLELVHASLASGSWGGGSGWAIGYPTDYNRGDITKQRYLIPGDQHTLDLLQKVYEVVCDLMATAYEEGRRRGQSFITDLAEGKLTVKDLERL